MSSSPPSGQPCASGSTVVTRMLQLLTQVAERVLELVDKLY